MRKGRKGPKDPFDGLSNEFRAKVDAAPDEVVNKEIRDAALYAVALADAKKKDLDLKSAQERVKDAGAVYKDGAKQCNLKIQYCKTLLRSRGREVPEMDVPEPRASVKVTSPSSGSSVTLDSKAAAKVRNALRNTP